MQVQGHASSYASSFCASSFPLQEQVLVLQQEGMAPLLALQQLELALVLGLPEAEPVEGEVEVLLGAMRVAEAEAVVELVLAKVVVVLEEEAMVEVMSVVVKALLQLVVVELRKVAMAVQPEPGVLWEGWQQAVVGMVR